MPNESAVLSEDPEALFVQLVRLHAMTSGIDDSQWSDEDIQELAAADRCVGEIVEGLAVAEAVRATYRERAK